MSVRVISAVWEHSKAHGSGLLVLLAIADFANDSGAAWPSIETIAKKARTGVRRTQDLLKELVRIGELTVDYQKARFGCNLYRVQLLRPPCTDATPQTLQEGCNSETLNCTPGGAIQSLQIAPDPSGTVSTRQEPPLSPPLGGEKSEAFAHAFGPGNPAPQKKARRGESATRSMWALKEQVELMKEELAGYEKKKKDGGQLSDDDRARRRVVLEQLPRVKRQMLALTVG